MSHAEKRIRAMIRPSPAMMLVTLIAGALAGTATGMMGGPLGAAIGAGIGATMGACAGLTLKFLEALGRRRETRLDRDIGVYGGDLGAAGKIDHPRLSRSRLSS